MHTGDEGTGAGARPRSREEIDAITRELLRAERSGTPTGLVVPTATARSAPRRSGRTAGRLVLAVAGVVLVKVLALGGLGFLGGLGSGDDLGGVPDHPTTYADGGYEFLERQPRDPDLPVGYNPCLVIPVDVNLSEAPPGFLDLLRTTIAQIDQASGLRLQYAGLSGAKRRSQAPNGRVLIAFDNVRRDSGLQDAAGFGGSYSYTDAPSAGTKYYVGGEITLNTDEFNHYAHRAQALVLAHEFGHVLGLGHVETKGEVMESGDYSVHEWGHGDLTGLAKLGSLPCQ